MNTQYRKNLKAVLEASKNYTDKVADNLQWQLGTYDLGVETVNGTTKLLPTPANTIQATMVRVDGKSVKYNQLVQNGNFESASGWSSVNANLTITNNVATFTATAQYGQFYTSISSLVSGHKYFVSIEAQLTTATNKILIGINNTSKGNLVSSTSKTTTSLIIENSVNGGGNLQLIDTRTSDFDAVQVFKVILIDLTLNYSVGNEPSTVEAAIPLLKADDYKLDGTDTYSVGKINNLELSGLKVEGSNLANPSLFELGAIDVSNGTNNDRNDRMRSNYIEVKPSTTYTLKWSGADVNYFFYNEKKVFISNAIGGTFTTTATTKYVRFYAGISENSQILFNEGTNSTYTPYVSQTLPIDLTSIEDSGGNKLFADGSIKSVGNVADEITPSKAVKRIGIVDLGSLDWSYSGGTFRSSDISSPDDASNLCSIYTSLTYPSMLTTNKSIYVGTNIVQIHDESYTDATIFKTAMSGVYLVYELATSIEADIDLSQLVKFEAHSNGSITLVNTNNQDTTSTFKYLKEVAK